MAGGVGKCDSSEKIEPMNDPVSEFPPSPDTGIDDGRNHPSIAALVTEGVSLAQDPSNFALLMRHLQRQNRHFHNNMNDHRHGHIECKYAFIVGNK